MTPQWKERNKMLLAKLIFRWVNMMRPCKVKLSWNMIHVFSLSLSVSLSLSPFLSFSSIPSFSLSLSFPLSRSPWPADGYKFLPLYIKAYGYCGLIFENCDARPMPSKERIQACTPLRRNCCTGADLEVVNVRRKARKASSGKLPSFPLLWLRLVKYSSKMRQVGLTNFLGKLRPAPGSLDKRNENTELCVSNEIHKHLQISS